MYLISEFKIAFFEKYIYVSQHLKLSTMFLFGAIWFIYNDFFKS